MRGLEGTAVFTEKYSGIFHMRNHLILKSLGMTEKKSFAFCTRTTHAQKTQNKQNNQTQQQNSSTAELFFITHLPSWRTNIYMTMPFPNCKQINHTHLFWKVRLKDQLIFFINLFNLHLSDRKSCLFLLNHGAFHSWGSILHFDLINAKHGMILFTYLLPHYNWR